MATLTASLYMHYILKVFRSVVILIKFTSNFWRRFYSEVTGKTVGWVSKFGFKIRTYSSFTEIHFAIIYNKPTRCNSGSIVFINNYKYALHQRFSNCGPRVLPLWSFQIEHKSKKDRKNKINVNYVSHTIVENLKQSLEITYNKRL